MACRVGVMAGLHCLEDDPDSPCLVNPVGKDRVVGACHAGVKVGSGTAHVGGLDLDPPDPGMVALVAGRGSPAVEGKVPVDPWVHSDDPRGSWPVGAAGSRDSFVA